VCVIKAWSVISGFRHQVDEICALLEYYAAQSRNAIPTFWESLSVPSSRVKKRRYGITTLQSVISQKRADLKTRRFEIDGKYSTHEKDEKCA